MINILLLSSLVSLITIGVLFLQRLNPEKLRIPSYFLGIPGKLQTQKIKTKPPFLWEILAVLLFTLGTCLAYFSQQHTTNPNLSGNDGLIWFDSTLSHVKALQSSSAARDEMIEKIKELRVSNYLFIELTFRKEGDQIPLPSYRLNKVSAADLEKYLLARMSRPTALSQPLDPRLLIQTLEKELSAKLSDRTLTLVTDAQAETLQPLTTLSSAFQAIHIVKTSAAAQLSESAIQQTALVPEELAALWNNANKESDASAEGLPGTPELLKVDAPLARKIPRQARPTLILEEFISDLRKEDGLKNYAYITSQDSSERTTPDKSAPPLFTTCTLSVAGPSELDGLSDLRAYAQFFNVPLRPLACRSTESATSSKGSNQSDPWKFRRASIWIVPVNDSVGGELFQQNIFWTPEGFSPETDALVYIADTRLSGLDHLLESTNVQLESNQPTVNLPLLPLPPSRLHFPWDLQNQKIPSPQPIEQSSNDTRPVLLKAADGTPLAFSLSQNPPVIYVRTGGAAPNGELGRWGQWASLWSGLITSLKNQSPLLTIVQPRTPDDWSRWFKQQQEQRAPALRYVLDGQNLKARMIGSPAQSTAQELAGEGHMNIDDNPETLSPSPALYIRERDDQMILIEPTVAEKLSEPMTSADLDQLFPTQKELAPSTKQENHSTNLIQWLGGLIAAVSLAALWILQARKQNSIGVVSSVVCCLIFASHASAQSNLRVPFDARTQRMLPTTQRPEITTHPFRIGWCDATIPPAVGARYKELQKLLARRGTIELPAELTAGACRLGASEIWWTSSLEALQAAPVTPHIRSGGIIIAEGITLQQTPEWMLNSADASIGLVWESPKRRGLLYRSFYLLSSFDGCMPERTLLLTLRKKVNAQAPMAIVTPARFLTNTSEGSDCFVSDDDYRTRSFVNMMYGLLTTDYKEDQMQLPEILNRVRNLGLEP
jgi:hypothetical protein